MYYFSNQCISFFAIRSNINFCQHCKVIEDFMNRVGKSEVRRVQLGNLKPNKQVEMMKIKYGFEKFILENPGRINSKLEMKPEVKPFIEKKMSDPYFYQYNKNFMWKLDFQ